MFGGNLVENLFPIRPSKVCSYLQLENNKRKNGHVLMFRCAITISIDNKPCSFCVQKTPGIEDLTRVPDRMSTPCLAWFSAWIMVIKVDLASPSS